MAQCESTLFATNNSLSAAGATVYFDVTAATTVSIEGIEINSPGAVGLAVGIEVWTTPTTYVGNELNMGAWTQVAVDDGTAVAMGSNVPTPVHFVAPFDVPAGTIGVALVSTGSGHAYTNGTGANQNFVGSQLTIDAGASSSTPFGGSLFSPRVFNGSLCVSSSGTGTSFCDTMPSNSTGVATQLSGAMTSPTGSGLHLEAQSGPPGEFGYFLVGTGSIDPGLPTGNGFLCINPTSPNVFHGYNGAGGGPTSIGRFDAFGILQNLAGTSSTGTGFDVPLSIPLSPTSVLVIVAGSTFHFQVWHRDTPAGVGQSNFSNGLSVTF